jgi:hypothetical protein
MSINDFEKSSISVSDLFSKFSARRSAVLLPMPGSEDN